MGPDALKVLVTGCSSGFGELIVKTLAGDGHHVFATLRESTGKNAGAAQQLHAWAQQHAAALDVLELDVTSDASVEAAVAQALVTAGTLDVVVNNAGVSAVGPLEAFSSRQIQALLDTNAVGPMRVANAVLPVMRAQRSGLIVFITSTLGRVLPHRGGLYPATKWAAEGLAESLHYQVAPFGIDVTILEPGSFPTPATGKSMRAEHQAVTDAYAAVSPPPRPQPAPADPAYRPPDPQEVADAVKRLVHLPAGARPLRMVVGPVFTEGVAEYNQVYERTRDQLAASLGRPDQALPWARR